ncbi:MAG: polyketide cyclase [Pseudonocardiales bacterium]|nr:MAG: polyketide cyclase [Pseudonocardiales bacterium]
MWSTEYTLATDATPEALWRLLSDVDGWGAWNAGIETIALDGPLAVGTTFKMKPPGEDELTSTVAELEPNMVLTDVTDTGDLLIRVAHRLQPSVGGGTSITYRIEVSGPAADAVGEEVGMAISADFTEVMAALAAAARATGSTSPR